MRKVDNPHLALEEGDSFAFYCPACGSPHTYCPGPFKNYPLENMCMGWRICYACGKVTKRVYRDHYMEDTDE